MFVLFAEVVIDDLLVSYSFMICFLIVYLFDVACVAYLIWL